MKFGDITAKVVLLLGKKKILIFLCLWTCVAFQWSKKNGEPWKPIGWWFSKQGMLQ